MSELNSICRNDNCNNISTEHNQLYCTRDCGTNFLFPYTRNCIGCGKLFRSRGGKHIYCGHPCMRNHKRTL